MANFEQNLFYSPGNDGGYSHPPVESLTTPRIGQFFSDIYGRDLVRQRPDISHNGELASCLSEALSFLAFHAESTLDPGEIPESTRVLGEKPHAPLYQYRQKVLAATTRINILQELYINGTPKAEIVGTRGQPVSKSALYRLIKDAAHAFRMLVKGEPLPGWMDGEPIDAIRKYVSTFYSADSWIAWRTLEKRAELRLQPLVFNVPLGMLPISNDIKRHLRGKIECGRDLIQDPTYLSGVQEATEIAFVMRSLTTDGAHIKPEWLG